MKKRLFVGSSVGGLDAAYAAQENLEHDLEVTVWSQGVFELNKTSIEALYQALSRFDAAAFIFRGG
ncbi:nucleotide-binding protein [Mesorhizobium sp. CA15]|uniref:nucleotide-binding protein n=1 Tax=Mesorhizobium sp. CA15 TaxID=2876641 RepID=UPI0021E33597|nr:nucleotide-binding protein [Mesorhizobium sp. CA15]